MEGELIDPRDIDEVLKVLRANTRYYSARLIECLYQNYLELYARMQGLEK